MNQAVFAKLFCKNEKFAKEAKCGCTACYKEPFTINEL